MAILSSARARVFLVCWFLGLGAALAPAQVSETATEYKIKAVCLVKFIQFVDWPSSAFAHDDSPLVIGVLGADPFGRVLDEAAEGETVKNRPVVIRRSRNLRELEGVQVLFIGQSEMPHIRAILDGLKGKNILSVSDLENFTHEGGVVRFLMENNRVRFRINVDSARAADLQISSKLLQLAEIVRNPQ